MSRNAGFTLLEVLVAIVLASLLLSCIFGVFFTSSKAKDQVEKQANALHLGRVFSSRLDRELLGLALNNQAGKAILAGGTNYQGEPYIEMLTSSSGGPKSGMRWVYYRLGPDTEGRSTLWRSEKGQNTQPNAPEERLAQGIEQLNFSFFDGSNWVDKWDSLTDGRPRLVRFEIELKDLPGSPPLVSVFELPQSSNQ